METGACELEGDDLNLEAGVRRNDRRCHVRSPRREHVRCSRDADLACSEVLNGMHASGLMSCLDLEYPSGDASVDRTRGKIV